MQACFETTSTFILSLASKIPSVAFVKISSFEAGLWGRCPLYSAVSKNLLFLFLVLVPQSMVFK